MKLCSPSGKDLIALADAHSWSSAGGAAADVPSAVHKWSEAARERKDVVLFEIAEQDRTVGQIFLHDIDADESQSLVGYHLLSEESRRRGVGTEALRLLVKYAREQTPLRELVIITSGDNAASRRIAEKNGFVFVGPPREDPNGVCLKLNIK